MKKVFLFTAVAAMLMTACGKDPNGGTQPGVTVATGITVVDQNGAAITDNAVFVVQENNGSYTFTYKLTPEGSVLPEGATVAWNSSETDHITLTPSADKTSAVATVTAGAADGDTSKITASFGTGSGKVTSTAITATAAIEAPAAEGIKLLDETGADIENNAVTIGAAGQFKFTYKLTPEGSVLPEGATIAWSSSEPAHVTLTPSADKVEAVATVTAGAQEGDTSSITASFGEGQDKVTSQTVTATVELYATGIEIVRNDGLPIADNTMAVKEGETITLKYKLIPEGTLIPAGATATWATSANWNILITPSADGTTADIKMPDAPNWVSHGNPADITVSFVSGANTVTSPKITATQYVLGIKLVNLDGTDVAGQVVLNKGASVDLKWAITPAGETLPQGSTVEWRVDTNNWSDPSAPSRYTITTGSDGKVTVSVKDDADYGGVESIVAKYTYKERNKEASSGLFAKMWDTATSLTGIPAPTGIKVGDTFSLDLNNMQITGGNPEWQGVRFSVSGYNTIKGKDVSQNQFLALSAGEHTITVAAINNPDNAYDDATAQPGQAYQEVKVNVAAGDGTFTPVNIFTHTFGTVYNSASGISGSPIGTPATDIVVSNNGKFNINYMGITDMGTDLGTDESVLYPGASGGHFLAANSADVATAVFTKIPMDWRMTYHKISFAIKWEGVTLNMNPYDGGNLTIMYRQWSEAGTGSWWSFATPTIPAPNANGWMIIEMPNLWLSGTSNPLIDIKFEKDATGGKLYIDDFKLEATGY